MATLQWNEKLVLNLPELDDIHEDFVTLLAQAEAASDTELLPLWQDIVSHTEMHFGLEDRWMHASGFAPDNCHLHQHQAVLEILHQGTGKGQAGNLAALRAILPDLATWFDYHAKTMDAALVYHLQSTDFDFATATATTVATTEGANQNE